MRIEQTESLLRLIVEIAWTEEDRFRWFGGLCAMIGIYGLPPTSLFMAIVAFSMAVMDWAMPLSLYADYPTSLSNSYGCVGLCHVQTLSETLGPSDQVSRIMSLLSVALTMLMWAAACYYFARANNRRVLWWTVAGCFFIWWAALAMAVTNRWSRRRIGRATP